MPFVAFVVIILFACQNNEANDSDTAQNNSDTATNQSAFNINTAPTISKDSMAKLFKYFKSDFKKGDTIITKFKRQDLIDALNSFAADTVKFVVGLFDDGSKKGKPMIFLRIPTGTDTTTAITTYLFMEGALCPPPDNCNIDN